MVLGGEDLRRIRLVHADQVQIGLLGEEALAGSHLDQPELPVPVEQRHGPVVLLRHPTRRSRGEGDGVRGSIQARERPGRPAVAEEETISRGRHERRWEGVVAAYGELETRAQIRSLPAREDSVGSVAVASQGDEDLVADGPDLASGRHSGDLSLHGASRHQIDADDTASLTVSKPKKAVSPWTRTALVAMPSPSNSRAHSPRAGTRGVRPAGERRRRHGRERSGKVGGRAGAEPGARRAAKALAAGARIETEKADRRARDDGEHLLSPGPCGDPCATSSIALSPTSASGEKAQARGGRRPFTSPTASRATAWIQPARSPPTIWSERTIALGWSSM